MALPERPTDGLAWELRTAWASRRRVSLALDTEYAALPRVAGTVEHVAASGVSVTILDDLGLIDVPLAVILSVRRPHFTEPADATHPSVRTFPYDQLSLL